MHTELDDPIVDMTEQNRYTAYVNVAEGRMGLFRFTMPVAGRAFFVLDPQINSINDELHAYLRLDGAPDLNDLADSDTNKQVSLAASLLAGGKQKGDIFLKAGSWTLGIFAKKVALNSIRDRQPSQFAIM